MASKLTKEELVDLVARIQRGEGSEEEISAMLDLLAANVPDPNVAALIFFENLSPEEVVERAFEYKPIRL